MKKILALFLACALCVNAFAGKLITLDAPLDCAGFVAGGGTATKVELLEIDYESGQVRFRLRDANGNALGGGAVFGLTLTLPADEDAVKAAVVAIVQAAH